MSDAGFKHIKPESAAPNSLTESQWAYVLDRLEGQERELRALRDGMQGAIAAGVVQGVKALAADPEFGESFWRRGFENLSTHAGKAGSQWVGSRLLTAAAMGALSLLVAWLVKTGRLG